MGQPLRWSRAELLADHAYARPHEAAGYALHGGLDADGGYLSPRTLNRWPAVRAWGEALEARGWPLVDCTTDLLEGEGYPTAAQHRLLIQNGVGRPLWNALSVTGVIEARGRALCDLACPDMRLLVVDDIADTATGHLGEGLLWAHGADEGGAPGSALGAHDAMWFAARDLVFGKGAYPHAEVPASIGREVEGREMPMLDPGFEQMVKFLMNVLMIEVRAESFFSLCTTVFRDPDLFGDRRADADLAASMVERIRTDEAIHVGYLQVFVSELRSFSLRTVDGGTVQGAEAIDPVWARMVEWHGRTERRLARERSRAEIGRQTAEALGDRAPAFMARFDALEGGREMAA